MMYKIKCDNKCCVGDKISLFTSQEDCPKCKGHGFVYTQPINDAVNFDGVDLETWQKIFQGLED